MAGRPPILHHWTYKDLADLCGVSQNAIEQAVSRREFDPFNFASLFPFMMRKAKWPIRLAMLRYGLGQTQDNPLCKKPRRRRDRRKK